MNTTNPMTDILEALLMVSSAPLKKEQLAEITGQQIPKVEEALRELQQRVKEHHIMKFLEVASGYQLVLQEQYVPWVQKLFDQKPQRLSKAFLEILALIAYKQPITRGEIEQIRGVAVSSSLVKHLLDQEWIKVIGYRDVPGRPALLATTKKFLDDFGLRSIKELPSLEELIEITQQKN